jgi:hypothetical protein
MADVLPNAALVSPDGTVYEAGAQLAQKKCVTVDVTHTSQASCSGVVGGVAHGKPLAIS